MEDGGDADLRSVAVEYCLVPHSHSHDSPVQRILARIRSGAITDNALVSLGKRFVNTGFDLNGQMLDFRVYDTALSASQVSTLYTDGPQDGTIRLSITPTVYPYSINLDWSEIDGASTYSIRMRVDSGE